MCTPLGKLVEKKTGSKSTILTGIRPGTNALGMIFDPLNLSGKFSEAQAEPIPENPDPAMERAKAEGDATTRANLALAATQRRRREQGSLIARGAPASPTFTLGDDTLVDGSSPLGTNGRLRSRSTTARNASLISRGAGGGGAGAVYGGGGGGSESAMARQIL